MGAFPGRRVIIIPRESFAEMESNRQSVSVAVEPCQFVGGKKRKIWPLHQRRGILPLMNAHRPEPSSDDYLLLPSVTHPGGRERAFEDAYKAMVRFMIEVSNNPTMTDLEP